MADVLGLGRDRFAPASGSDSGGLAALDLGGFVQASGGSQTTSVEGAEGAGFFTGKRIAGLGGALFNVGVGIARISSGIESISEGRDIGREGKKIRDQIAERARLEFRQRGVLAQRLLSRQRAQFAAAGAGGAGTQAAVQEFTSTQRALERRLILNDALATANRIARQARRQEKKAKRRGYESILQSFGDFLDALLSLQGAADQDAAGDEA